jgi:YD repeat-containing protein
VTRVTDPLGRKTDFSYDSAGNVTSITRLATTGDAVTTSFTYEPTFSQVATITDPLSHTTDFEYDALGRLTMVTDPLGHETTFTYNTAGQPVTISNDASETVTLGYERGDLVSITNPLSHSTLRYVDAAGRLLRSLDPLGRTTTYEYNALNLITKVIDALAGQTTFTFLGARGAPPPLAGPRRVRASRRPQALDGNGNLLTLTDARSKTTTWTYDDTALSPRDARGLEPRRRAMRARSPRPMTTAIDRSRSSIRWRGRSSGPTTCWTG